MSCGAFLLHVFQNLYLVPIISLSEKRGLSNRISFFQALVPYMKSDTLSVEISSVKSDEKND